jgi:predicted 3-demethylubiquinone-9 3-methyltransferase (glyoxalase superfamily)
MPKITTFLTFQDRAEQAAKFYVSVFPDSRILNTTRVGGLEFGDLVSVTFELGGQQFMALNGGPTFSFSQGISLFVSCDTQAEVDRLWSALSAGGAEGPCGWLTDKFGVSWQIVPAAFSRMVSDQDSEKAKRAINAMLQMRKLDIAALERAYAG